MKNHYVEKGHVPERTLLALGDIAFRGRHEDKATGSIFEGVAPCFKQADFVVANLESPLVNADARPVAGKCTLRGRTEWAAILKKSGIDLVTLANNHMMDYGEEGLFSTMSTLDNAGITYVGAGKDRQAACQPVFKEIAGRKIAFFGRSSVEVSSRCYADIGLPGAAAMDKDELFDSIRQCRNNSDIIIVMMHWGMEEYHYPSPSQRFLAKKIISTGADILIGHHPHVLQGEEGIDGALISYSSGNFLFDEFPWSISLENGTTKEFYSTLSERNRQGMMLEVRFADNNEISTKQIFTRISEDATVELDREPARKQEYKRFCSRLHMPLYDVFWKMYSMKREWDLRLKNQLALGQVLRKFYKIRPMHFKEMYTKFRRSTRIASGKTTNPYDG
jgi:poly-gamma-glutamate capsule biosynthesis protein CapA/YwtB (metallophosphatase superfamily)